jgi:hypothetical protein
VKIAPHISRMMFAHISRMMFAHISRMMFTTAEKCPSAPSDMSKACPLVMNPQRHFTGETFEGFDA